MFKKSINNTCLHVLAMITVSRATSPTAARDPCGARGAPTRTHVTFPVGLDTRTESQARRGLIVNIPLKRYEHTHHSQTWISELELQ